jgi:hypothetical protein
MKKLALYITKCCYIIVCRVGLCMPLLESWFPNPKGHGLLDIFGMAKGHSGGATVAQYMVTREACATDAAQA